MQQLDIINIFKKDVRIICLTIGGFYTLFGTLALIMIKIQSIMISNFDQHPDRSFLNLINILHNIFIVYMPFMILIGVCYLVFGLLFKKIKTYKYEINLVLSLISLIWVIAYALGCLKYLVTFNDSFEIDFASFKYLVYGFAGFGFIAVFALFTVPQFIIGKKIKNINLEK